MWICVKEGLGTLEITEAMKVKLGPCGYVWVNNLRGQLVSLRF